jgi:peptidyl-prolyl cis-trans isomerase C
MQMIRIPLIVVIGLFMGCSEPTEEAVILAKVGQHQITVDDFVAFTANIPDGMKTGSTPAESNKALLSSLIDKTLLLAEASALDLENDPEFLQQIAKESKSRILALYQQQEISEKVVITDEELEAHQRATYRDRALRFSGIMLETMAEAEQVIAELQGGADFHKLAAERSIHRETAERGGDSGGYKLRDQVIPIIAESVFPLAVGEVSKPTPVPHEGRQHFVVFMVLDEMPVPLDATYERVKEEVFAEKRMERITELLAFINEKYQPQIQEENIGPLAKLSNATPDDPLVLPEPEGDLPLVSFSGGEITLAEFLTDAKEAHVNPLDFTDPERIKAILDRIFIPAHLFMAEAIGFGIDQDPRLDKFLAKRKTSMLLSLVRGRQVDQYIAVSEDEARAFYDANPEKFVPPATTIAAEVLVASDSLAQQVKRLMQEGEDPQDLYDRYSLREEAAHHNGRLEINAYNQSYFPEITEVMHGLDIGQVGGPVKIKEGYSIFKILERRQEKSPYNEESQRRSNAYVKVDKAKRGYVKYVRSLREKYPVDINEDSLQKIGTQSSS